MAVDRLIFKLTIICLIFFYSSSGFTDLNKQMFDLSMNGNTHSAFMQSLQDSLNLHPESLLQDSLIAQQINQAKIIETDLIIFSQNIN